MLCGRLLDALARVRSRCVWRVVARRRFCQPGGLPHVAAFVACRARMPGEPSRHATAWRGKGAVRPLRRGARRRRVAWRALCRFDRQCRVSGSKRRVRWSVPGEEKKQVTAAIPPNSPSSSRSACDPWSEHKCHNQSQKRGRPSKTEPWLPTFGRVLELPLLCGLSISGPLVRLATEIPGRRLSGIPTTNLIGTGNGILTAIGRIYPSRRVLSRTKRVTRRKPVSFARYRRRRSRPAPCAIRTLFRGTGRSKSRVWSPN